MVSSEVASSEMVSSNPPLPPYSLPPYSLPRSFATSLVAWIAPRVLELVYTAYDMEPFARDCGYGEGSRVVGDEGSRGVGDEGSEGAGASSLEPTTLEPRTLEPSTLEPGTLTPFLWNEERRFLLRCELDALYFHLYGIERDDVDYILETFPIVRRKDEAEHGEFRTRRVILEIYDALKQAMETGVPYQTRLDPPPAHGWTPPEELLQAAFAPAPERPAPAAMKTASAPAEPEDLTLASPPAAPAPLRDKNGEIVRVRVYSETGAVILQRGVVIGRRKSGDVTLWSVLGEGETTPRQFQSPPSVLKRLRTRGP
jgi:hypothetical protein